MKGKKVKIMACRGIAIIAVILNLHSYLLFYECLKLATALKDSSPIYVTINGDGNSVVISGGEVNGNSQKSREDMMASFMQTAVKAFVEWFFSAVTAGVMKRRKFDVRN